MDDSVSVMMLETRRNVGQVYGLGGSPVPSSSSSGPRQMAKSTILPGVASPEACRGIHRGSILALVLESLLDVSYCTAVGGSSSTTEARRAWREGKNLHVSEPNRKRSELFRVVKYRQAE